MISKQDQIIEKLAEIREDIAGIKEHLRTLNGKILKQEEEIQCTDKKNTITDERVRKVENKLAYYIGALGVIVVIAQTLISKFL